MKHLNTTAKMGNIFSIFASNALLAILFCLISYGAQAQEIDSLLLRQMDSIQQLFQIEEITVKASLPKTRMKGDAICTRVAGSVLEQAGTAEDVLSKVPGIVVKQGQIEVLGKGTPIYYINGRKVEDPLELQRLQSTEIKEVEVIRTPGAQYNADANAIVKIRTVKREGEGWGLLASINDANCPRYSNNQLGGQININYRFKNLDFIGGIAASDHRLNRFVAKNTQEMYNPGKAFIQSAEQVYKQHFTSMNYHLGIDWQISENHSAGVRMERQDNLIGHSDLYLSDTVMLNGQASDLLESRSITTSDGLNSWLVQAYYTGKIRQLELNLNLDYYHTHQREQAVTDEISTADNRSVETSSRADGNMYAGKLVIAYPSKIGILHAGAEVSLLMRHNQYRAIGSPIPADTSRIRDNIYGVFADYGFNIPKAGVLNVGLRYECTDFRSRSLQKEVKRLMHNVYPSASFCTRIGQVESSLSYAVKTYRPNYRALRSSIEYTNRYMLTSGNPNLKNEINHQAAIQARWRFLSGVMTYEYKKNGIFDWAFSYDNNDQIMMYWVNLEEPIHRLSAFINASPTIGVWHMNYTVGVQKQWLKMEMEDCRESNGKRIIRYNKPMWIFNANNAFVFPTRTKKHGPWVVEINSELFSAAHWGNAELMGCNWNLSVVLQKTWLKNDALSVRLKVNDIFHTAYQKVKLDMGNIIFTQTPMHGEQRSVYDPQTISVSVRYRLNYTKKEHNGAGKETRGRL